MKEEEIKAREVAQLLGVCQSLPALWRHRGVGPPYRRRGFHVHYIRSEVLEWNRKYR